MKNNKRRKWTHAVRAAVCALVAVCGFASCDEGLEPWEIVSLEASCSQEGQLSYDGGTFTVSVDANTDWTVTVPEWMTVDKTSGTGPGMISVAVGENESDKARGGTIVIKAGASEPNGNIAGQTSKSVSINQQAKYQDLKIDNVIVNLKKKRTPNRDDYYDYYGTVTYTVETRLTDEEVEKLFLAPNARLDLYGPSSPQSIRPIDEVSLTKGTHTITFDSERIYGNYIRCDLYIRGSEFGSQILFFTTNRPYIITTE